MNHYDEIDHDEHAEQARQQTEERAAEPGGTPMRRAKGIAYLTQCADRQGKHWWSGQAYPADECRTCNGTNDAGHLRTFSRYGATSAECAPVAWRVAYLVARETGTEIDHDGLDHAMSLVVNDHEDVAYMVNTYGHGHYR